MRSERLAWVVAAVAAAMAVGPRAWAGEDAGPTDQRAKDAMALLASDDPYQRQVGFLRLEALRDPSTVEAVRRYLDSTDPERRAEAVRALAAIEGVLAVPRLLAVLRTDKQPLVRRAALLGLEPLAGTSPDVLPAFLAALRDRKPEVRMAAVDIVSRIDDPRARDAIRLRNRRERDRNVRRVLSLAMTRLN
jgi:HEAT repeat protein